jgi:two-component system KDP operon response regulator KdpE
MVMAAAPRENTLNILIVEDDAETAEVVCDLLNSAGYRTTAVDNGEDALSQISDNYDLVVLDINLPDINGLEVLRRARNDSYVQPMIILSGYGRDHDRVTALEDGADDYLAKPFSPEELVARVKAILRRMEWMPRPDTRLQVRQLELDVPRRLALIRGKRFNLTPIEYGILVTLMRNAGQVITHDELLKSVWGDNYSAEYSVLRVNISRLRQKVEETPRRPNYIVTVPGQGYYMPLGR